MDNTEGKTKIFIIIWHFRNVLLRSFLFYKKKRGKYIAWNSIDLTNQRFNKLTAVEKLPNYKNTNRTYYRCICDCRNECFHSTSNLKNNKAYSCGCETRLGVLKRIDYTGQKFNNLTVKKMLYNYKDSSTYAECDCDCGNTTIAYMGNIKAGKTKSCGCIEINSRFGRKNHEKDLTGKKFGHLTVIKLTDKRYSNNSVG